MPTTPYNACTPVIYAIDGHKINDDWRDDQHKKLRFRLTTEIVLETKKKTFLCPNYPQCILRQAINGHKVTNKSFYFTRSVAFDCHGMDCHRQYNQNSL